VRILITGAPGSGTTTVGRAIASELGAVFLDADDYFWLPTDPPYKVEQSPDARLASVLRVLEKFPSSVIAGSVVGWGEELENSLSHVVYLWVPPDVRVQRLIARESKRFGAPLEGFIEWAAQYDEGRLPGRSRAIHERWLSERNCPVPRIEGDVAVTDAAAQVMEALSSKPRRSTSFSGCA
jgi:adenylate kinase family enzyme